jgi:hypothetical protein
MQNGINAFYAWRSGPECITWEQKAAVDAIKFTLNNDKAGQWWCRRFGNMEAGLQRCRVGALVGPDWLWNVGRREG